MPNNNENTISKEMWQKYHENKDLCTRNKILTHYLNIVTINAKRMSSIYKNKEELDDIVNQGVFALIDCIERYNPDREVKFETYASIRIRGAIIDYIRKQDWVPRDIRKKSLQIENSYLDLQTALNRPPKDEEVAESIGLDMNEYNKIISQSYSFSILSYEDLIDNTSSFKEQASAIKAPEQAMQEKEIKSVIAASIDTLNDKERLIISLYYYEELKLKEIAVILGISSSRVSQIHSKSLFKMGKYLKDYING